MTIEKMKQILIDEVPWQEVTEQKNKGICEFYEQNGKSLGISYEDIDDEKDVYIYNIFLGDEYINISNKGTKDNPITEELLNELVTEWNSYDIGLTESEYYSYNNIEEDDLFRER